MNYCILKKYYVVFICLTLIAFALSACTSVQISNENNEDNKEKNSSVDIFEKNDISDNEGKFYITKVLNNGNIVNFYVDENGLNKFVELEIVNPETNEIEKTIDISSFDIEEAYLTCLNDYFYICGNFIYVYNFSGDFIKEINYPLDIAIDFYISNTAFAVSNDLSKIAYSFKTEDNEEDKIGIKLLDLNTNEETVIQSLNEAVTDKPCNYTALHFSSDDKTVMFFGQRYLTINDAKDCYGVIDLKSLNIKSDFADNSYCRFIKDCGYIYDKNVAYTENGSGKVIKFDKFNNAQTIELENKNESRHFGLTDDENMFLTVLCDSSDYSIEVKLYKNSKAIKKADIKCENEEEFNLINTDEICYSSKSNKIYYSLSIWDGDEYTGNEYFELEMN
ncbi:MAG: hypothetical protein LIO62_05020 [Clostridiales bacterium]|nr:hypothetical protein [Clostridiales bacterium]